MSDFTEPEQPKEDVNDSLEQLADDVSAHEYQARQGIRGGHKNVEYIAHKDIDVSNVPEETTQELEDVDDSRYNAQSSFDNDSKDWRSIADPPGDVTPNWFRKGEGVDLPEHENPHHDISDSNFGRDINTVLDVSNNDSKLVERSREEIHPEPYPTDQSFAQDVTEDSYVNDWGEGGEILTEAQMRADRDYKPTDGWGGVTITEDDRRDSVNRNPDHVKMNVTPLWLEEQQGGNISIDAEINERNQGKFEPYDHTNVLDPDLDDDDVGARRSIRSADREALFSQSRQSHTSQDSRQRVETRGSDVSKQQIDEYLHSNADKHSTPLKNRVSFSGQYDPNDSQNATRVALDRTDRSDASINSIDAGFAATKSNLATPEKSRQSPNKIPSARKHSKNRSQSSFRDSLLSSLHLANSQKSLSGSDESGEQQPTSPCPKGKHYTKSSSMKYSQQGPYEHGPHQSLPIAERERFYVDRLSTITSEHIHHSPNQMSLKPSSSFDIAYSDGTNLTSMSNQSHDSQRLTSQSLPLSERERVHIDRLNATEYMDRHTPTPPSSPQSYSQYTPNSTHPPAQASPVRRLQFNKSLPNRPYDTSVLINGRQEATNGPYHHINNGSLKVVANPSVITPGGARGVSPQKIQHMRDAIDSQINDLLNVTHGPLVQAAQLDSKKKSSIKYFATSYLGHFTERIDVINNVLQDQNDRDFTKLQQDLLQEKEFLIKQVGILSRFQTSLDSRGIPDSTFFHAVQSDLELRTLKNDALNKKLSLKQLEVDEINNRNAKLSTDIFIAKRDILSANKRYEDKVTENTLLSSELSNLRNENNAAMIKLMKTEDSLKIEKSGSQSVGSLSKKRSSMLDIENLPTDQKEFYTKLQAKDKLVKDLKKNVEQLQALVDDLSSQKGALTELKSNNAAVIENLSNEVFKAKQEVLEKEHTMSEIVRDFTKKDIESKSLQTSLIAASQENEILVQEQLNSSRDRLNVSVNSGSGDKSQVDTLLDINGSLMRENDRLTTEALNLSARLEQDVPVPIQNRSINTSHQTSLNTSTFDLEDLKDQISMLKGQLSTETHSGRVALLKAQKQVAFYQSKCSQESSRYASRDAEIDDMRAQLSRANMQIENLGNDHVQYRSELEAQVNHYRQIARSLSIAVADTSLNNTSLNASQDTSLNTSYNTRHDEAFERYKESLKQVLRAETAKIKKHYEEQCSIYDAQCDRLESVILRQREQLNRAERAVQVLSGQKESVAAMGPEHLQSDRLESVILKQREQLNRAERTIQQLSGQKESVAAMLKTREKHLVGLCNDMSELNTENQDLRFQHEEHMLSMGAKLNKTQDTSVLNKSLQYLQSQVQTSHVNSQEVEELRVRVEAVRKLYVTVRKVVHYCKLILADVLKINNPSYALKQAAHLLEFISQQPEPNQVISSIVSYVNADN